MKRLQSKLGPTSGRLVAEVGVQEQVLRRLERAVRLKLRHGRDGGVIRRSPEEVVSAFWGYVKKTKTCWLWKGERVNSGAGRMYWGRHILAHRLSYAIHHGSVPDGMCVCHTCDVPYCVNPDHLFIGSQRDNMADMARKCRGNHRLTISDVAHIRKSYRSGELNQTELARKYGVAPSHISNIVRFKQRKHV